MSDASDLKPGAALSTLFWGYDEIPLDRINDEDELPSGTPAARRSRAQREESPDSRRPLAR